MGFWVYEREGGGIGERGGEGVGLVDLGGVEGGEGMVF